MSAQALPAVFWILLGLCFLGILVVMGMGSGSGPDGGMGVAWLVVIPIVFLVGLAVVFAVAKSDGVRIVCVATLALPLLMAGSELLMDPIRKRAVANSYERAASGAHSFREPAQLRLAAALRSGDLEMVTEMLPAAGDLNRLYGETTLFLFALERGEGSVATRLAIAKTLLEAGANPNVPPGAPLRAVSYKGREFLELLLDAGADVNYAGTGGEPYWWTWLGSDDKRDMVQLMLAHGANLQLRVRGFGPVSQAAHKQSWKTVLLLMEAGAPYKGEPSAYAGTLYEDVKSAATPMPHLNRPVEPEVVRALAMLEAAKDR